MTTEVTFTRIALTDPPLGICVRCSELAMQHTPTGTKFAFCEHTATGGMLAPGSTWFMVENVSAENFKQTVGGPSLCAPHHAHLIGVRWARPATE
jgi:hypothetical protein